MERRKILYGLFLFCLSWPNLCLGQEGNRYLVMTSSPGTNPQEMEQQRLTAQNH